MTPKSHPLAYTLASALIVWQLTVIAFFGPWARGGALYHALLPVLSPYVRFFQLNGEWRFYAQPEFVDIISYRVDDGKTGNTPLSGSDIAFPVENRFAAAYEYITYYPRYAVDFGRYLCRLHTDAHSITLQRHSPAPLPAASFSNNALSIRQRNAPLTFNQTVTCN